MVIPKMAQDLGSSHMVGESFRVSPAVDARMWVYLDSESDSPNSACAVHAIMNPGHTILSQIRVHLLQQLRFWAPALKKSVCYPGGKAETTA
jgi:hypothetical protein